MTTPFEHFQDELNRLVATFGKGFNDFTASEYSEARLREDFLNPLFRALGWDMENKRGLVQSQREVEIESRTDVAGRAKRADYLFRVENRERFVCEAKKPREVLGERYAFQTKRYAWNKGLPLAVLSDFEEIKIYVVGGRPNIDRAEDGLWKTWNFRQYPLIARELWDLLARERVATGSIDTFLDSLPKAKAVKGKARQQWLIRPERIKALDQDFLEYLDEQRHELASELFSHNPHAKILADGHLNEATQRILDRLLFLRICEDRDIDTGCRLAKIVETWRRAYGHEDQRKLKQGRLLREEAPEYKGAAPRESLWWAVVNHLRALDRRPAGNMPFFNGNLFKQHFSEDLRVGDQWLCDFIEEVSADESPYLFSVIPVEILGSVYERFLGKVVRPQGRGVTVEEKPEVRKAGGVYYTPRYIVDYIVEQTVGRQLDAIAGVGRPVSWPPSEAREGPRALPAEAPTYAAFDKKTRALRILDPACGSGSFLIRAFERVCEHYQRRFITRSEDRKPVRCWTDPNTGDVHLTVDLKRRILRNNIYGVDLDAQAVEVTQLSLYLKMLEGEDRTSIARQRELFRDDTALLPPLEENIKHGNSLIASDFSLVPDDLLRVHAFDWDVQFADIMKAGGFDAVIGNPPWGADQPDENEGYFERSFRVAQNNITDSYALFMERAVTLLSKGGRFSYIVPDTFLRKDGYKMLREVFLNDYVVEEMIETGPVFSQVRDTWCLIFTLRREPPSNLAEISHKKISRFVVAAEDRLAQFARSDFDHTGIVRQQYWSKRPGMIVGYLSSPSAQAIVAKMETHPKLSQLSERYRISRGEEGSKFNLKRVETSGFWMIIPENVHRYDLSDGMPVSLHSMTRGKIEGFYSHPKIWIVRIQKMRWPQRIVSVLDSRRHSGAMKTLQVIVSSSDCESDLKYLQAILASRLVNFWCVNYLADDMNQTYLERLPIRQPDLANPADRTRHDQLVELVDKMLALMPKLRAETDESKKKTLQNAVDATDRQIDRLVYELYGLTEEEIGIVDPAFVPTSGTTAGKGGGG